MDGCPTNANLGPGASGGQSGRRGNGRDKRPNRSIDREDRLETTDRRCATLRGNARYRDRWRVTGGDCRQPVRNGDVAHRRRYPRTKSRENRVHLRAIDRQLSDDFKLHFLEVRGRAGPSQLESPLEARHQFIERRFLVPRLDDHQRPIPREKVERSAAVDDDGGCPTILLPRARPSPLCIECRAPWTDSTG